MFELAVNEAAPSAAENAGHVASHLQETTQGRKGNRSCRFSVEICSANELTLIRLTTRRTHVNRFPKCVAAQIVRRRPSSEQYKPRPIALSPVASSTSPQSCRMSFILDRGL